MKFKIAREPFHDFERGKLCPSYSGFIKRRKNKNQGLFFHLAIITQRSPKTAPPRTPPKSQKYSSFARPSALLFTEVSETLAAFVLETSFLAVAFGAGSFLALGALAELYIGEVSGAPVGAR